MTSRIINNYYKDRNNMKIMNKILFSKKVEQNFQNNYLKVRTTICYEFIEFEIELCIYISLNIKYDKIR